MGLKNYHTHTPRCMHARGKEEEYILAAIEEGFDEIGFTDHTPWKYDSDFVATMRMPLSSLDDYLTTLRKLKDKYKDQISIKIGLECEYFEKYMPWLKQMVKDKQLDYIILGNHYQNTDEHHVYFGYPLDDYLLNDYVNHCIKAIDTGLYSYIAHPDLANFDTSSSTYKREMSRLCAYAKEHDVPLEFNLLGYTTHRHYPNKEFWKIASHYKNKAIIGFDVHDTYQLRDHQSFDEAYQYLSSLDVELIDTISFLR